ncbi:hypothetical protein M885DRAFT_494676 [Pelagophyceae sp. CCMP2097]|nr:hypothetical protein M885DRAFT_494676 [Pelagophyceae sp. CCMP2097]
MAQDALLAAYASALFVFLTYALGSLAQRLGSPALVGEIVAGMAVGPKGFDLLPNHEAWAAAGTVGLVLLVLEGGLHVDLGTLKRVGRALSSTAIGMSAKLMADLGVLDTDYGRLVVTAAMFDDVLSLVLLAVVTNGLGGDANAEDVAWPVAASAAFLFASLGLARAVPRAAAALKKRGEGRGAAWAFGAAWSRALVLSALATCAAWSAAAHYARSTYLLGAFTAGVAFAAVSPVSAWTSRVFFGSVGFVVPVGRLFSAPAVGYGALVSCIAVITKVVTGVFDWDRRWEVGVAMVGRGELGFIMAEQSFRAGLTSPLALAVTVWALLVATLVSPVVLRRLLRNNDKITATRKTTTEAKPALPAANGPDAETNCRLDTPPEAE